MGTCLTSGLTLVHLRFRSRASTVSKLIVDKIILADVAVQLIKPTFGPPIRFPVDRTGKHSIKCDILNLDTESTLAGATLSAKRPRLSPLTRDSKDMIVHY
jgi:hypothetical protein